MTHITGRGVRQESESRTARPANTGNPGWRGGKDHMPDHGYLRTRGVRWNKETMSFEMWCPSCAEIGKGPSFWPITTEYWPIHDGLTLCKACRAEAKRQAEKNRRTLKRHEIAAKNKAYYHDNRELLRWKDNQRKARHRENANLPPQGT